MEASGPGTAVLPDTTTIHTAVVDLERNIGEFNCTSICATAALQQGVQVESAGGDALDTTSKNRLNKKDTGPKQKVRHTHHQGRGHKKASPPPGVELFLSDVPSAVTLADLLRLLAPVRGHVVTNIREFATPPGRTRRKSLHHSDSNGRVLSASADAHESAHDHDVSIAGGSDNSNISLRSSIDSDEDEGYPVLVSISDVSAVARIAEAFQGKPYSSLEPHRLIVFQRVTTRTTVPPPRFDPCPICLDHLTPTDGSRSDTVTMLCSHSFHGDCLAQCLELRCPVCRYVPAGVVGNRCHDCEAEHGLWMCLVCGHLGCAREQWHGSNAPVGAIPSPQHALKHFDATGHSFAQAIDTQQVWNYSTDGYAEWLGQGHGPADKLAEVQRSHPVSEGTIDVTQLPLSERDASEALALEYTHLLCSRLESDREQYRAEQCALERAERERVQRCADQLQEVRTRKRQLEKEIERMRKAAVAADKDCARLHSLTANAESRYLEEKQIADSMAADTPKWNDAVARATRTADSKVHASEREVDALRDTLAQLFLQLEED